MPASPAFRTASLPFPWSDGPALAPVLRDPDLWPLVLTGDHRRIIKLIRPPQVLGRRRLAIDDDASFGAVVIELLASPATRTAASQRLRVHVRRGGFEPQFGLADLLAEYLVLWLVAAPESPCAALLPDAIRPTIAQSALTPARFRELASTLPVAPSIHAALLACAQGIFRRRDALAYAAALVDHSSGYRSLLFGPQQDGIDLTLAVVASEGARDAGHSAEPRNADGPPLRIAPNPTDAPIACAPEQSPSPAPEIIDSPGTEEFRPAGFDDVIEMPREIFLPDAAPTSAAEAKLATATSGWDAGAPDFIARLDEIHRLAAELGASPNIPVASSFSSAREYLDELELVAMDLDEQARRRDRVDALAAASADRILAVDPLTHADSLDIEECIAILVAISSGQARDPRAARWRAVVDDDLLVTALVVNILHADPERASRALAGLSSPLRRRVARGLDSRHLAEVLIPGTMRIASLEIIARVLAARRPSTLLAFLQPALYVEDAALSPKVRDLIEACIHAGERKEPVDAILRALAVGRPGGGQDETRALILTQIDHPPGMTGTYHRLRVSAQSRFLRPLRDSIANRDPQTALARLDALGDVESMVAECISDLPGNVLRDLEDKHIDQTRRYLVNFRESFENWAAGPEDPTRRPGARGLVTAWTALLETGEDFVVDLQRRAAEPNVIADLTGDIDRWWYRDGERCLTVDESAIRPTMLRSWIAATRGEEVPLDAWAWERARVRLDPKWSATRSVERMLAVRDPRAARMAADLDPSLDRLVTPAIEAERRRLAASYAAPLSRAQELRARSSEVDDYLASVEDALSTLNFVEAELWLEGLDDLLMDVGLREDPERRALVDFLAEACQRPSTRRPSVDDLQSDVDELREREGERRWHVLALETTDAGLADHHLARLRRLANALDRPSRWPNAERSRSLADAIETVLRYAQEQRDRWREYHEIDPDDVTRELIDLLERTLAALPDGGDALRILDLAREIALHAPFERFAELVSPSLRRRVDEAYYESVRAEAREHLRHGEYTRVLADLRGIRGSEALLLQAELGELLHRGTPLDLDWSGLRRVLGQLRSTDDVLNPRVEALDAIARVIQETPPKIWPIDHLARSRGGEEHHRAALFVLSLHLRVAQRRPPSEGITLAMVLPEQIFRVWARWTLGLDFQRVPEGRALTWRHVKALWDLDGRGNVMRIPEAGEKFPSFRCFAIFAQVESSMRNVAGLERGVNDLYAALRTLQVRHDGAHALAQASAERRRSFFELIERWLDRLYLACPVPVLRDDLEALLEPFA
ncbi:MAG TPA: hypothetical protein PKW35_00405 [Nannocystaceae bacterium]|nr:hypothetical protein [Nannocystaceae bacterium]